MSAPLKPLQTILEQEMDEAHEELARPAGGLFLSGLLAGIGVGFSVLLIAALTTHLGDAPPWLLELLVANAFTVGFILVIVARTDLYTEYTTIAILPWLDGQASFTALSRLWGLVFVGNIVGTALIAGAIAVTGPALDVVAPRVFGEIAGGIVDHAWWVILLSSVLAGWLMGMLSWLVTAGRETMSQIFLIWLVTGLIGYLHLHHAITGAVEVLAGMFRSDQISSADFLYFLGLTTVGNAIGGIAFATIIHHSALLAAVHESRGASSRAHGRRNADESRST